MRLIDADAYAFPGDLINEPTINPESLRPKGEWISVEDRLPKREEQALCRYVFNGHNDRPFFQVLEYYAFDAHPHFQYEGMNGMRVTHWMPLPEPPNCGADMRSHQKSLCDQNEKENDEDAELQQLYARR